MAADETYDIKDLQDLKLDDLNTVNSSSLLSNFDEFQNSQLCIPQDSLDDVEWYPNSTNDLISISSLLLTPEHQILFPDFSSSDGSVTLDQRSVPFGTLESEEQKSEDGARSEEQISEDGARSEAQRSEHCARIPFGTREHCARIPFKDCSSLSNRRLRIEDNDFLVFASVFKKKRRSIRPSETRKHHFVSPWLENQNLTRSPEETANTQQCLHCQAQKTPQWRMGPFGPKTLCNACGVRYKSGRLLPEYRPAASPTFNSLKHSNFHKKIMRQRV